MDLKSKIKKITKIFFKYTKYILIFLFVLFISRNIYIYFSNIHYKNIYNKYSNDTFVIKKENYEFSIQIIGDWEIFDSFKGNICCEKVSVRLFIKKDFFESQTKERYKSDDFERFIPKLISFYNKENMVIMNRDFIFTYNNKSNFNNYSLGYDKGKEGYEYHNIWNSMNLYLFEKIEDFSFTVIEMGN